MVGFKKFLLATSLLLGSVVAAPTSTGLNVFEERDLSKGTNAAQVCESQFVQRPAITSNGNSATVVDLTGCTALFFYSGTTLNSAYHIFCGNELTDGETAGEVNSASTYVVVVASSTTRYNNVRTGILNGNSGITVGPEVIYGTNNLGDNQAIAVTASDGSTDTTQATVDRVCTQPGEES